MSDEVIYHLQNGVFEIILNRPKANAINCETSRTLYDAFNQFNEMQEARVAIITGQGDRFFSAGWDLKGAADGEEVDADHGPGGFAGITEFFDLRKPVIAAVNGMAVGGGFELALACDLIICADHASFFLPEISLGIIPDSGGVLRLPKRLPRVIVNHLLFTGHKLVAKDALKFGLVNSVTSSDNLMADARKMAQEICQAAPLAIQAIKAIHAETENAEIQQGYQLMRSGKVSEYQKMLSSSDAQEGILAFSEKRSPQWQGK